METVLLIKMKWVLIIISLFIVQCSKHKPIASFDDINYELTTHQNEAIQFPKNLEGRYTVFGFFYTHCPDICPLMVANMKRVDQALGERREEFDFVFMTFDPDRDSVEVLKSYFDAFKLDSNRWNFLTATNEEVDELTKRMGVVVQFQPNKQDESGQPYYLIDHTDKVSILNEDVEMIAHFNASRMNPEILARELLKLKDD